VKSGTHRSNGHAERFGDLVDEWGTLNEPMNYLLAGYGIGQFPPGLVTINDVAGKFVPVVRDYISAHAAMYDAIKAKDTVDADGDGTAATVGLSMSVADWRPSRSAQPSTEIDDIAARDRDERFEPSHSTVFVSTIEGGTAHNIVPKNCEFQWQVRGLPEASPDEVPRNLAAFAEKKLLPQMRRVTEEAAIDTANEGSVPAFVAAPGSEAVALALALTGADRTKAVSYTTEAGLFEEAGVPAVICGPGNIAHAHAADEYVAVAQLEACLAFLDDLAKKLSE